MNYKNLILTSVLSMAVAMPAFCSSSDDGQAGDEFMMGQFRNKRLRQDYADLSQVSIAKRSLGPINKDFKDETDDAFDEYLAVELLLGLVSE